MDHVTKWFADTSREVFAFGDLLPVGENLALGEQKQSEKADEIVRFLDRTLETDGPTSLLYVSGFSECRLAACLIRLIVRVFRSPSARLYGRPSQRRSGHFWTLLWRRNCHS